MKAFKVLMIGFLFITGFSSCKKEPVPDDEDPSSYTPTPYTIDIPKYFPTLLYIPADNPMTEEGIALGRYLFYDGRLAGRSHPDSLMSCASCHLQQHGFHNNKGYAYGIDGVTRTHHTMMPLINMVWNPNTLLWSGRVGQIEDFTWMGIMAPHEMGSDTNRAKALIQSIPEYPPMFEKAFGSKVVTVKNMGRAIAQFVRTLISANSTFDKYLRGEANLSNEEFLGYVLFTTEEGADCFHCHGGDGNPLFTTNLFYNNAKDSVFDDPRDRYSITGVPSDIGAYKAPTLRNVELRAPYMHDGRFSTLEEVVDFYNEGLVYSPYAHPLMHKLPEGGAHLNPTQKQNLIAFLKCLTDTSFVNNPDFGPPPALPQEFIAPPR